MPCRSTWAKTSRKTLACSPLRLIWQALVTVVTTVAAAPFRALGNHG
jgi:hypothetical protein